LDPSFTPDNTVIFSEIDDENGDEQIMIPTAMVLSLDNHVECAKRGEDAYHNVLQLPGNADWNFANIKGSPT
jgi:hypothetical protein